MNRAKQQLRQSIEIAVANGNSPRVRYGKWTGTGTGKVVGVDSTGVIVIDDETNKRRGVLWAFIARIEL